MTVDGCINCGQNIYNWDYCKGCLEGLLVDFEAGKYACGTAADKRAAEAFATIGASPCLRSETDNEEGSRKRKFP